MEWYHFKLALTASTGVSQDALHIFAGVIFQILLAAVLRVRLSHLMPWLAVLGLELANEYSDLHLELWPDRAVQYCESVKDLLVTMAVPTLLLVLVRFAPGLFAARGREFGSAPETDANDTLGAADA